MSFLDKITAHLPIGKDNQKEEYYFALHIGLSQVDSAVWGVFGHKIDILGKASLEYEGTNDLFEKANQALDEALGALEIEPQKILFGVPESWSIDDNLKEPYLKLLRRMVKEYELEPMAYVTTTHALSHLLQKQDGVPPTALLLGIGDYVECTWLKGGKVIEARYCKRSEQLFEDIERCLSQFTNVEMLPSKICLYSTKPEYDLSAIREDFMSYNWVQRLSFLHFPKVEILENDVVIQSIVLAGAVEIDPNIDFKHSFPNKRSTITPLSQLKEEPAREGAGRRLPVSDQLDDAGFVVGDIREQRQSEASLHQTAVDGGLEYEKEDLEDDSLMQPAPLPPTLRKMASKKVPATAFEQEDDIYQSVGLQRREETDGRAEDGILSKLPLAGLKGYLAPAFGMFTSAGPLRLLLSPIGLIPLLLIGMFLAFLFMVKAEITVYVEPKVLENTAEVVADPKVSFVDEEEKIIPAETVMVTVTDSATAPATGEKEIGDPAKGQIVIYNKTNSPRTFSQGTVLVGPNNLKFTLDSTVTVASQSAIDEGIKFGKATGSVTASSIGPDGNLPADEELSFEGLSTDQYSAKVDQAFSGGTSKKVTVVTADDQRKLKAKILETLKQKAKQELEAKVDEDKKIITDALSVESENYRYSKAVGDQAKDFSVNATVEFKGTAYSDSDLKSIVASLVQTEVPDDYHLNLSDTETFAEVTDIEDDGKLIFTAKFKANLVPKMDEEVIKKAVAGKRVSEAGVKLKEMDHVLGTEIKLRPGLPAPIDFLPLLTKNITVKITPK